MQAIAAGCDGVLDLQRRRTTLQAAALEALIHAVEEERLPVQARRGRARAPAPREGAVPLAGRGRRPHGGAALRTRARQRRASARSPTEMARFARRCSKPRGACARATASPSSRPPARSPVSEFDAGVAELRRARLRAGLRRARVRAATRYLSGDAAAARGRFDAAWRDPSIAALIAVRGGYGSVQLLPLLDPVRLRRAAARCSSATATTRRC